MIDVLLYIHQLPQNIVGLLVILFHGKLAVKERCNVTYYVVKRLWNSGISLGNYIIFDSRIRVYDNDVKHEHGHQIQSLKLGWLYLIVVGLVSVVRNVFDRIFHKKWSYTRRSSWYYSSFPEKQADQYGGANRLIFND